MGFKDDFKDAYEKYYARKISYTAYGQISNEAAEAYAVEVLDSSSPEDIQKKWFIDYGLVNSWNWETVFDFKVATILHEYFAKLCPHSHVAHTCDTHYGWHESSCSCGLKWCCDSGD